MRMANSQNCLVIGSDGTMQVVKSSTRMGDFGLTSNLRTKCRRIERHQRLLTATRYAQKSVVAIHTQCIGTTIHNPSISRVFRGTYSPTSPFSTPIISSSKPQSKLKDKKYIHNYKSATAPPHAPRISSLPRRPSRMCFRTIRKYSCGHSTSSLATAYGHPQPCPNTTDCILHDTGPCPACLARAVAWAQAQSGRSCRSSFYPFQIVP